MAVKLWSNRIEQFVDGTGVPRSGAKLFTYVGGSVNTKQTTYTESTGSTPNTNPIVLDSAGRIPQPIWLTTGVSYKFVLAPPTDTDPPTSPIDTLDVITGINDSSSSQSEWIAGPTPTFVSTTQFTLAGDQTANFSVGRRIKATVTAGTVYGRITVSAFAVLTTITVVLDSGNLDSGLSAISYGILSAANSSIPSVTLSSGNWTINNTLTAAAAFSASNSVALSGTISPTQISASQNDYSPTSFSSASTLRLSTDASRNVTGLAGGADGRIITLVNVGSNPLVLTNQDAASTAANRFLLKSDTTLAPDQSITLRYDNTTARWRPLSGGVTKQPTLQVFTSGSGTYTTPAGATRVEVQLIGGGGGGGGTAADGSPAGTVGGNTTFSTLTGNGGGGGVAAGGGATAGGAATGGDINISGGSGSSGAAAGATDVFGGSGGNGFFGGGAGGAGGNQGGSAGATNSGGGGSGHGGNSAAGGGGGGAGGYAKKRIVAPAATYSYGVGAGGAAATSAGAGGSGIIIVDEFYD